MREIVRDIVYNRLCELLSVGQIGCNYVAFLLKIHTYIRSLKLFVHGRCWAHPTHGDRLGFANKLLMVGHCCQVQTRTFGRFNWEKLDRCGRCWSQIPPPPPRHHQKYCRMITNDKSHTSHSYSCIYRLPNQMKFEYGNLVPVFTILLVIFREAQKPLTGEFGYFQSHFIVC